MKKLTAAIVALGMSASVFAQNHFDQVVSKADGVTKLFITNGGENTQGLNVVKADSKVHAKVDQVAMVDDLRLDLSDTDNNVQGANVAVANEFTGKVRQEAQLKKVSLDAVRAKSNVQGVNVIKVQ